MSKPIIKKRHNFRRLVLTGAIFIAFTVGSAFSFTGCFGGKKDTPTASEKPPVESILPDNSSDKTSEVESEIPQGPKPQVNISFEDFMKNHSELALGFANQYVKADLTDNKMPLSETWGFHANDQDELDSLSLTYTYASSDTTRVLEVANATFTSPIDLDDIVAGEVETVAYQVTRQTAFEFDAKTSFLKSEFANALCDKVIDRDTVKYFSEVKTDGERTRQFQIAEETPRAINVYSLLVAGTSEEEILANMNYSFNYEFKHIATYPLGDKQSVTMKTSEYQLEEFAPENVDEAIKDFNTEIASALDQHFLSVVGKDAFGKSFDKTKIQSYSWDIGTGDNIDQVKFIATYNRFTDSTIYVVYNIDIKKPIIIKDLTKNNIDHEFLNAIENATISQEYFVSYATQIQGTRDKLVNSIFEAYGMSKECPEGAVRYYIAQGATIDATLGESHAFKVVEISENSVKEFSIRIKTSSSDEEFVSKLSDQGNYRIYDEKSCVMEGSKIVSHGIDEDNTSSDVQKESDL